MHHPDLEYQILLSMSKERISGKPIKGLRQPREAAHWRLRLLDKSGSTLISIGSWLKAHSDSALMARATTAKAGT